MSARILALAAPLVLGACSGLGIGSSDFACSGMPEGISCKSAREVYELTNSRDHVSGAELAAEMEQQKQAAAARGARQGAPQPGPAALGGAPVAYAAMPVAYTDDGRVPIRTPAVVMRMWVAPYEDTNGDLHMPGFVFTEVDPRRWSVGLPDATGSSPSAFRPLEAKAPKPRPQVVEKPPADTSNRKPPQAPGPAATQVKGMK